MIAGPLAGWALARSTEPDVDSVSAAGGQGGDGAPLEVEGGVAGSPTGPVTPRRGAGSGVGPHNRRGASPRRALERPGPVERPLRRRRGGAGGHRRPRPDRRRPRQHRAGGRLVPHRRRGRRSAHVGGGRRAGSRPSRRRSPTGRSMPSRQPTASVLAAFAVAGQSPVELADDVILLEGDAMVDRRTPAKTEIDDGSAGRGGGPAVGPPVEQAMPEPGEPPADEDAARDAIEQVFLTAFDGAADPPWPDLRSDRRCGWTPRSASSAAARLRGDGPRGVRRRARGGLHGPRPSQRPVHAALRQPIDPRTRASGSARPC